MAYDARNLSVIAYANGFTLWHYSTEEPGFNPDRDFHRAGNILEPGDIILTSIAPGNGPADVRVYGVVEVHKAKLPADMRVHVGLMASTGSTSPGGGVCAAGWSIPYIPSPVETRAVCAPQDQGAAPIITITPPPHAEEGHSPVSKHEGNIHKGNTP